MTKGINCCAAIIVLVLAATSARAGPCTHSIARVQAQFDGAIEKQAGADGWKPECPDALRGYQPTPQSLAATEGSYGPGFENALHALARARAADSAADSAGCLRALTDARTVLHH